MMTEEEAKKKRDYIPLAYVAGSGRLQMTQATCLSRVTGWLRRVRVCEGEGRRWLAEQKTSRVRRSATHLVTWFGPIGLFGERRP